MCVSGRLDDTVGAMEKEQPFAKHWLGREVGGEGDGGACYHLSLSEGWVKDAW